MDRAGQFSTRNFIRGMCNVGGQTDKLFRKTSLAVETNKSKVGTKFPVEKIVSGIPIKKLS